jgi:hypothetical protein
MENTPEFIQLENDDDSITVRDRLRFLRGKRVALVWPDKGTTLTRKLDLVLIQREAMRNNIRLALVTHDERIIHNAADLNLSAFETVSASRRKRWKRGRSRAFVNRSQRPLNAPLADDLMPYASRVRGEEFNTPHARAVRLISRIALIGILLAVILAALYVVLPSAQIRLTPARQVLQAQAIINADPALPQNSLDVENGIMPAITYRAEIEERGTIPTTGIQALSSTSAVGTATFINLTNSAVDVPAGALVSTSAGTPIVFRTTQDVTVPAGIGEQIEAPIEAVTESAGEIGNVETGLINVVIGPLADQVDARNFAPTYGGESRSIRLVTQADYDALIATLRQQLQDRAYRELAPLAAEGQFIIPEAIRISEERSDWQTFDHAVGDIADNVTLTMRAVVAVTAVDEELAQQIAYARLGSLVPTGRVILPESLVYSRGDILSIAPSGSVVFEMTANSEVQSQVDDALVQNQLAGQTVDEALTYLESALDLQPGTQAELITSPSWLERMPLLPMRIFIERENAPGNGA